MEQTENNKIANMSYLFHKVLKKICYSRDKMVSEGADIDIVIHRYRKVPVPIPVSQELIMVNSLRQQ